MGIFSTIYPDSVRECVGVFTYAAVMGIGGFLCLFLQIYFIFFTTYLRWAFVAYLIWIHYLDRDTCSKGGRSWTAFKTWSAWRHVINYFPTKLIKLPDAEFEPKKNYFFCCFPHGLIATGVVTALGTDGANVSEVFPNHQIHISTLNTNFKMPFFREIFLWFGMIGSSVKALSYVLANPGGGKIVALAIGGAREGWYSRPGKYILVLKNRRGFVRIAMTTGASLVPVITFGEPDIVNQMDVKEGSKFHKFQMMVKNKFSFIPLIPQGRDLSFWKKSFMPFRKPMTVVVGRPIPVTKNAEPTQEEVDKLYHLFVEELTSLFEKEKHKYIDNFEGTHLEII